MGAWVMLFAVWLSISLLSAFTVGRVIRDAELAEQAQRYTEQTRDRAAVTSEAALAN